MQKAIFLALTLATVALAGCADGPASGNFQVTESAADYRAAGIEIVSTPATNDYPQGGDEACGADAVGGQDPTGAFPYSCQGASSTVAMVPEEGVTLPIAGDIGYTLYLLDADRKEEELGTLEHHGNGHFAFPQQTYDNKDFSSGVTVQLRVGDTVVAVADAPNGNFDLFSGLAAMTAGVSYEGATINVAMDGIPNNTALTVWLVDVPETENEDGDMVAGDPVHTVEFAVAGEFTTYTLTEAQGFVGDYEEFHVHITGTSINVLKIVIPEPVE